MPKTQVKNFSIVIEMTVKNKSVAPKGFNRYKPFPYDSAQNWHKIVYKKKVAGVDFQAVIQAKDTDKAMAIYMIRRKQSSSPIANYRVILHDHQTDKNIHFGSDTSACFFHDGTRISNKVIDLLDQEFKVR
jgi:hypothetical protein